MVWGESKDGECFRAHTNYVKFKFQHPVNKILGTQPCSLGYISSVAVLCCEASRVVTVETMGPQNLTYLLADPLQKKFHPALDPCWHSHSNYAWAVISPSPTFAFLCIGSVFILWGQEGRKPRHAISSQAGSPSHSVRRIDLDSVGLGPSVCQSLGQGKLYSDQTGVTRPSRAGDGSVPPQPGRLRRSAGCWTNPSNLNLLRMDFGNLSYWRKTSWT